MSQAMNPSRFATPDMAQRARVLAQILGEPETLRMLDWSTMREGGVLAKLHIRRWGAAVKLTYDDLGLETPLEQEPATLMALGEKYLLPIEVRRKLDSVEKGARSLLKRLSFQTGFGTFVPRTAYEGWKREIETWKVKYFALRDQIVADYPQLCEQVLNGYTVVARNIYAQLAGKGQVPLAKTEEEFVEEFKARIKMHFKTPEQVEASFAFEVELMLIPPPPDGVENLELAQRTELATRPQAASSIAEWQFQQMLRDVLAQAQENKEEQILLFYEDLVGQIRKLTYEVATNVLRAIRRNKSLPPSNVRQLNNLIEQVRRLNFYGDREIEQLLEGIRAQLSLPAESRNLGRLEAQLRAVALVTRATLQGLGKEMRSERELGIADVPSEALVRQARAELGLDAPLDGDFTMAPRQGRMEDLLGDSMALPLAVRDARSL